MLVTKFSPISKRLQSMWLPVTEKQLETWEFGGLVQDVFPHLKPEEREFLTSGITPSEWIEMFGEEDE